MKGACTETQTRPSEKAIPAGAPPTSMVFTTSYVSGSIRETVPSPCPEG